MKSFQVQKCIDQLEHADYSDLQVLRSAAGYYIGTVHDDGGFKKPGSRDTNYFPTQGKAAKALAILEAAYEDAKTRIDKEVIEFEVVQSWEQNCLIQIQMEVTYRWTP